MWDLDRIAHTNRWRTKPLAEKLVVTMGLLAADVIAAPGAMGWIALAAATLAALGFARIPWKIWAGTLALPLGFCVTGILPMLFPWNETNGSMVIGLLSRAMGGTACLILLTLTTPAPRLIAGLKVLRIPSEILEIALLTYRFIFILGSEAMTMSRAQEARMGRTGRGWRKRIKATGQIIAQLAPRSLERARRMELGLAARNWRGPMPTLAPAEALRPQILLLNTAGVCACITLGILL